MARTPNNTTLPLDAPAQGYAAVTPHASNPLPVAGARGFYVGVGGDMTAVSPQGDTVLFKALAAGVIYPIAIAAVRVSGTTATDIVALY